MHRYRNPGEQDGEAMVMGGGGDVLATGREGDEERREEETDTPVFEKHDNLLHGESHRWGGGREVDGVILGCFLAV